MTFHEKLTRRLEFIVLAFIAAAVIISFTGCGSPIVLELELEPITCTVYVHSYYTSRDGLPPVEFHKAPAEVVDFIALMSAQVTVTEVWFECP